MKQKNIFKCNCVYKEELRVFYFDSTAIEIGTREKGGKWVDVVLDNKDFEQIIKIFRHENKKWYQFWL